MNTLLYSLFMISLISSADSTQPPSNHIFKTEGTAVNIGCLADIRHRNLTQISILKQRGESLVWCYTKKVDKKEKKRYNRIKHREEKEMAGKKSPRYSEEFKNGERKCLSELSLVIMRNTILKNSDL